MTERTPPRATDTDGLLLGGLGPTSRIGQYIVESQLPTRGSGHEYLGSHVVLPRRAVIKVLPAAAAGARELALELLREACILDAIDHPGVPRLFETGMLLDRRLWVAIEHVEGTNLADALDAAIIDVDAAVAIVRDVADIIATVHAQGLIHANVVPSALVMPLQARRHPICLVDWAAARTIDSMRPLPLTPPQASIGYLAPEQLRGQPIDASADVYALGMIARELEAQAEVDLPPMFAALVERMTDPDPNSRPSSAEVREATMYLAAGVAYTFSGPNVAPDVRDVVPDVTERMRAAVPITSEAADSVAGEIVSST